MSKWKPISTAPKETSEHILVYRGDRGFEDRRVAMEYTNNHRFYAMNGFTHWQPLPTPPVEQSTEDRK